MVRIHYRPPQQTYPNNAGSDMFIFLPKLQPVISIAPGEDECLFLNDIGKVFTNSVFCSCNRDWTESVGSVPHIVSVTHIFNFIACRLDRKTGTKFVNVGFLCAFPGGLRFF